MVSCRFPLQPIQYIIISNFVLIRCAPGAKIKILNIPQQFLPIIALQCPGSLASVKPCCSSLSMPEPYTFKWFVNLCSREMLTKKLELQKACVRTKKCSICNKMLAML